MGWPFNGQPLIVCVGHRRLAVWRLGIGCPAILPAVSLFREFETLAGYEVIIQA